ncbi:MAG: molybdopterin molybdotransferase MoeA [Peptococcaceae bacterium]|nr:molybdopterin molybdotransferase MoeA [Peptococcaceae bacterium]
MKTNISLEEAQAILLDKAINIGQNNNNLTDTLGRTLSKDIIAQENVPPFPRSPYDGYAFRSADTMSASDDNPVILDVIEEVPAGYTAKNCINSGQAIKILTGAPIPEGADAVCKFEETSIKDNKVALYKYYKPQEGIVPAGEDIAKGTLIASKGTVVTPPLMGMLAALGISVVPVFKRPLIAIGSTGDELCDVSETLAPGKIRNSNSYTLQGYIRSIGAEPIVIGMCQDRIEDVASLIEQGLERADLVLTTGGVSVGDYDVVRHAVDYLQAEILFWKVDIKPGSPILAAVKNDKLIIGLSGNPAAAMVTFQLLVVPLIKKIMGRQDYLHPQIDVILKDDFPKASPRRRFLRGKLVMENGIAYMEVTGGQGNGVLSSLEGCNLLAEIPAQSGPIQAGKKLKAYIIN